MGALIANERLMSIANYKCSALFRPETMARWAVQYVELLDQVGQDPGRSLTPFDGVVTHEQPSPSSA